MLYASLMLFGKLIAFMLGLFLFSVSLRFWDSPDIGRLRLPRTFLGSLLLIGIGLMETFFATLTAGIALGFFLTQIGLILLLIWTLSSKSELRMMIDHVPPEGR